MFIGQNHNSSNHAPSGSRASAPWLWGLMAGAGVLLMVPEARAQDYMNVHVSKSAKARATDPAQPRYNTRSGLPVPRYVSLKSATTNCRIGPSLNHPRLLTFTKKGLPVRVIAETVDHWRKIEDSDGDQCWVHATLLSGVQTALIMDNAAPLHARPSADTRIRARIASGVIARVHKCRNEWCKVEANRLHGWVLRATLWGFRG